MSEKQAIYIHIPFCKKKCVYCDFYSDTELLLIPDYVRCLVKEIEMRTCSENCLPGIKSDIEIDTVYFGGGTPSLLGTDHIKTILCALKDNFSFSRDMEITLEVNPGTIDPGYFSSLFGTGVNRLSIGAQSFIPEKLSFLQRIHTMEQSFGVIEQARKGGFENISLDLIYGLPFEDENMWLRDLRTAIDVRPSHFSCYMLTVEPLTPLGEMEAKGLVKPLDQDALSRLFTKTSNTLSQAGFEHYEISSFAQNRSKRSRHNAKYWDQTPYQGFGASAHSYDGNARSWNHCSINAYIKDIESGCLPVEETETLSLDQKMLEMIMLGLRTIEGVDLEKFKTIFGAPFEILFKSTLNHIFSESLGRIAKNYFFLNLEGKIRLDSIVEAFAREIV